MGQPTVLVTGGAGFIGSHVAERFDAEGWAVRVLDDLSTGFEANCRPTWRLDRDDVVDADATRRAVAGCDVVVHLAAFTSVPDSFEHHERCYRTNVRGTFNVVNACVDAGVEKLVFGSTSAVYAEAPDTPKSELDCPDPISPYAVSKLEGEHLLDLFSDSLSSIALRFFNVYGPRQPADGAYAAVVPIFASNCVHRAPLTFFGNGSQTRDFVFVRDVADAIHAASRSRETGVFNVGTGEELQIRLLGDMIARACGVPPAQRFEPPRPGDVQSSTADVSRIRDVLGWTASVSLEDGLRETIDWFQSGPEDRRLAG